MTFQIIFNVMFLFVLLASVIAFEDVHPVHLMQQNKGNILCRNCGSDITLSDTLISKSSPKSRYSFNDTLFYIDDVLVQVFATDLFFHYTLISFTYSTCVPTGEWEESTSWYPGFVWKLCVCPDCGAYIGFVFEPMNPSSVEPSTTFYGLILTSLISEHCKYNQYYVLGFICAFRLFGVSSSISYCNFSASKKKLLYCVVH